tara:strand:- start:311 stop:628 length:318 start_codon:yes stop_codon:yes gene_type:complete
MIRTLAILGSLLVAVPAAVLAQSAGTDEATRCDVRKTVIEFLSDRYREQPVAMGVAENGGLVEVLASREGSTFTIIVTNPGGQTCMVAAGEGWEDVIAGSLKPKI